MSQNELGVILLAVSALGGAWGARSGGLPVWKGMALVAASMIVASLLSPASDENILISLAVAAVAVVLFGSVMKMTATQIGKIVMAAGILFGITALVGNGFFAA